MGKILGNSLEDQRGKLNGVDGHLRLLVQRHGNDAILEAVSEELQLGYELCDAEEGLQGRQTLQTDIAHLPTTEIHRKR